MKYPLDYRIGMAYLPETSEMTNEKFVQVVTDALIMNGDYAYEIFYTAMFLAVERMTTANLLEFMINIGQQRDITLAKPAV